MPRNGGPPQKLRSAFSDGWTPQKKAMVDAVVLPKQLRCYDCAKLVNVSGFSEKQCKELRNGIVTRQVNPGKLDEEAWLRCRKCSGMQPTEMECIICEMVKGHEDFAKAQRRNPDRAVCMDCVYEIQTEPTIEKTAVEAYRNDDEDYDSDGTSNVHENSVFDDSEAGGAPLSSHDLNEKNLRNLDLSTGGRSSKPAGSTASTVKSEATSGRVLDATSSAGVGSWQAMSGKHRQTVGESASGTRFTGYDPSGGSHQRVRAPSTVDSDDSGETMTAEPDPRDEKDAKSKFARIRGPRKELVRPQTSSTRKLPARRYDSDDNDDDDDDDDEYFTI